MQEKYEALKSGLQELIQQMKGLISSGDYEENEEMDKKDVKGVMSDVEDGLNEAPEEMEEEENPLHAEMRDFMKNKNLGSRPKGLKAVMVKASVKPDFSLGKQAFKGKK